MPNRMHEQTTCDPIIPLARWERQRRTDGSSQTSICRSCSVHIVLRGRQRSPKPKAERRLSSYEQLPKAAPAATWSKHNQRWPADGISLVALAFGCRHIHTIHAIPLLLRTTFVTDSVARSCHYVISIKCPSSHDHSIAGKGNYPTQTAGKHPEMQHHPYTALHSVR